MIRGIICLMKEAYYKSSSKRYISHLKKLGARIGHNVTILGPSRSLIDEGRASWITIGDNVILSAGCSIMAHDYSWSVLRKSHDVIAPTGGGEVIIGNNVFVGINSIILRNVIIGDNSIVGAGSVVTKSIPANSVAAGNPAKVIMSLDAFCEKRKQKILSEAINEARHLMSLNGGKDPELSQMLRFACLFMAQPVDETLKSLLYEMPVLGDSKDAFLDTLYKTKPLFKSYADFIEYIHKEPI